MDMFLPAIAVPPSRYKESYLLALNRTAAIQACCYFITLVANITLPLLLSQLLSATILSHLDTQNVTFLPPFPEYLKHTGVWKVWTSTKYAASLKNCMIEPKSCFSSYCMDIPLDVIWHHPDRKGAPSVCVSSHL